MPLFEITPFRQLIRAYTALLNVSTAIAMLPGAMQENERTLGEIKDALLTLTPPEPIFADAQPKQIDLFNRMSFNLLLDQTSVVDKTMVDTATWEPEQLAYFSGLIERFRNKKGALFLDIGSYWGLYSLIALRSGAFEKLYAFDADLHNFAQLQANLFLNNATHSITALNKAVSDKPGTLRFWDSRTHPNQNRAGVGVIPNNSKLEGYSVEAITIDSLVNTVDAYLLMKIDVEGHEESALRGMENTLAKNKVVMQIEIFPEQHDQVFAEVNRLGLRTIHCIFPDYYLTNIPEEEFGF